MLVAALTVSTVAYFREAALGVELSNRGTALEERPKALTKALEATKSADAGNVKRP